jgi:hypothetical protein
VEGNPPEIVTALQAGIGSLERSIGTISATLLDDGDSVPGDWNGDGVSNWDDSADFWWEMSYIGLQQRDYGFAASAALRALKAELMDLEYPDSDPNSP